MGKRELLIVIAFVAMGVVAYELVTPAGPAGSGFSFSQFWQNARRHLRGNRATATVIRSGHLAWPAAATEVRVHGQARGVRILGEARPDVSWELTVESTGPDEATARQYAQATAVSTDDLGSALAVDVSTPREATQWPQLVLHVPARLAVRIEGGSGAQVSGVASVRLEGTQGETTVSHVAGRVTGSHRSGSLTVTRATAVNLSLVASEAVLADVTDGVTLTLRAGTCALRDVGGPIEIDATAAETTLVNPSGPVRVNGSAGRVTIERPQQEVRVDLRSMEVDVTLDRAVPLTLLTTSDDLHLTLVGTPAVALDAVASGGGHIDAAALGLTARTVDGDAQLAHTFGTGRARRVVLRNQRGNIVISKRK